MKLRLTVHASVFALACALAASPAVAQQSGANCRTDADTHAVTDAWPTTRVGLALAEKACQAKEFVKKLFTAQGDPDKITPGNVLDAEKPQVDPALQHARDEYAAAQHLKFLEEEKRRQYLLSNPANEAVTAAEEREQQLKAEGVEITQPFQSRPGLENELYYDEDTIVIPPKTPDGLPTIISPAVKGNSEGRNPPSTLEQFHGEGTVLSEHGIEAGTFEKGELDGPGEEVTENGAWRAGTFDNGELDGPGIEIGRGDDGKNYMLAGTFKDDSPDGQMTATYEGGSSRRELWNDGLLVSEGDVVTVGTLPKDAPPNPPNAAWHVDSYQRLVGGVRSDKMDVASLNGATYIVNKESDRTTRDGMMQRVFGDGTVQFEEWQDGKLVQSGERGAYDATRPPAPRPRPAAAPAVAQTVRAPTPAAASTYTPTKYASVCSRNKEKIVNTLKARGLSASWATYDLNFIEESAALVELFKNCVSFDSSAKDWVEYSQRDVAEGRAHCAGPHGSTECLLNGWGGGAADNAQWHAAFMAEFNRAMSDPNYSADLGTAGGPRGASAPPPLAAAQAPAGNLTADFNVSNPVLSGSFYARYAAQGLPPATVQQQANSDAVIRRFKTLVDTSGDDLIAKQKYLIAMLEAGIVIYRQAQDVGGMREQLQQWVSLREKAIQLCKSLASNPGDCLAPLR